MLNKGVHWEDLKKGEIPDPTDENNAFEKKFKSLSAPIQLLQIWAYFIMKIGRGFRPNQHQNYDILFPLMVIWAHRLTGLTHLTTLKEVHKQLNDLTSDERMPPAFVKHIVMDASQTAKLKVPSGRSWPVQLSRMVTGTYLHDVWPEFIKDNSLKDFDLLLLRYDGNRRFTVRIFDKTACEREEVITCNTRQDTASCSGRTRRSSKKTCLDFGPHSQHIFFGSGRNNQQNNRIDSSQTLRCNNTDSSKSK